MSVMAVLEYFKFVLQLTEAKREQSSEVYKEYFALEQVPPAPGIIIKLYWRHFDYKLTMFN